jgi:hypothetical protein
MPSLSDIATVTRRGGNIPDVEAELAYSGYCLYEAVKAEMQRSGSYEVVKRGDVEGMEGKVSVPTVLKFLWPDLFRDKSDMDSDRIRKALYQFLRDTRNLICITPGHMREMSTWWARNEWNEDASTAGAAPVKEKKEKEKKPEPAARPAAAAVEAIHKVHTAPAATPAEPPASDVPQVPKTIFRSPASEPCRYCGRTFVTQAHLTKHIYKEHESLADLILAALTTYTLPVYLTDLVKRLHSEVSYSGAGETIRTRLVAMTGIDDGIVNVKEEEGDRRLYSVSSLISMENYERTVKAVSDAGLANATYPCREPACAQAFFSAGSRSRHEDESHLDSAWRVWRCQLCSADRVERTFYNQIAWAVHISSTHGLGSLDGDYQILRRDATRLAAQALDQLKAVPEAAAEPEPEPAPPQAPPVPASQPVKPAPAPAPQPRQQLAAGGLFTVEDVSHGMMRFSESVSFLRDLAQAYKDLLTENESLHRKLAVASAGELVPQTAMEIDASLAEENKQLRQQLATLQRIMANLT